MCERSTASPSRPPFPSRSIPLVVPLLVLLLWGCAASEVRLVSYLDPYFPETYELRFDEVVYWQSATGDLHIVAVRVPPGRRGATPAEEPPVDGAAGSSAGMHDDVVLVADENAPEAGVLAWPPAGEVAHYLSLRMFWRPQPGKTPANSTTMNVILQYVVAGPTGALAYTGTGFAYPEGDAGRTLRIALESGRLQLEARSGDLRDGLGNVRITGQLLARHDRAQAASWLREAELHAGR